MNRQFKDHFSDNSKDYSTYRPTYPEELFAYLASLSPSRYKAWDCATGTGQAAQGLKRYYREVIGTDASASQIANAKKDSGITYSVAAAEKTSLGSEEIDLITVAQALHWFKFKEFFNEADRVLKPNGILAVWSYNLLKITSSIDAIMQHCYDAVLGDYWPEERRLVEDGYAGIAFPFHEIPAPSFAMRTEWNLNQLVGYLGTWSAVKRCTIDRGASPIPELRERLLYQWGNASNKRVVVWPLSLKIRKKCTP